MMINDKVRGRERWRDKLELRGPGIEDERKKGKKRRGLKSQVI